MFHRKITLFSFIITLVACNSSTVSEIENKDYVKKVSTESIRNFESSDLLFLSFYRGMNKSEFKNALKVLLKNKKVGIRKKYDEYIKDNRLNSSLFLDSSWIDSSAVINKDEDFLELFSLLVYKMAVGEKEYYAELSARFNDSDELIMISLKLPIFTNTSETIYSKEEIIKIGQKTKAEIVALYSSKYGSPKTQLEEFKLVSERLLEEHGIKPYNLAFIDKNRKISIFPSCCINFEPTITYELISDLEIMKSDLILKNKKEKAKQDSLNLITKKEI